MTSAAETPGARLQRRVRTEFLGLRREIALARQGKDAAVHRARKAIQRIRSWLRLLRPVARDWVCRLDARLARLRRRLGRLRDAAVRLEVLESAEGHLHADLERTVVDRARLMLAEQHARLWARFPGDAAFWGVLDTECNRMLGGLPNWPTEALTVAHVERAITRARRVLKRALRSALGRTGRHHRHQLRRCLRRFASVRRVAALALKFRDPSATKLDHAARSLGKEGDLWLARTALRRTGSSHEVGPLCRQWEQQRREWCKRHDGELVALRRNALKMSQVSGLREKRGTAAASAPCSSRCSLSPEP